MAKMGTKGQLETGRPGKEEGLYSGFNVLNFTGPEWQRLADSFSDHGELAKCLIWFKNAYLENGKFIVESTGVRDYILQQSEWRDAIKMVFPDGRIAVDPHRTIADRMIMAEPAYSGLSVQINSVPVQNLTLRQKSQVVEKTGVTV